MSVNKVMLLGNLGRDPETKDVNQSTMCRFPIATTQSWTDSSGERKERTEWHNIVVWGGQAKSCGQYLGKGDRVFVEGEIRSRQIQVEGEEKPRYLTEIRGSDVRFITRKGGGTGTTEQASTAPAPAAAASAAPVADDQIPF